MLRSLVPRLFAPARHNQARLFSAQPASSPATGAPSEPLQPSTSTSETLSQGQSENVDPSKPLQPYHVPRNSRGSIPVYSQIRNHTKYFILLRDVQGNVEALMHDLQTSLFPQGSEEAARLKISLDRRQRVVLSGGRWKNQVIEWLVQRGF